MIRGDFQKLDRIVGRVGRIGSSSAQRDVTQRVASEALHLIRSGFAQSTDPYGKPWKPVKCRGKGAKPLVDTGTLRDAFVVIVRRHGFIVRNPTRYAAVHQHGATIRPRSSPFLVFRVVEWSGPAGGKPKEGIAFARKVRIPARKMVPERGLPQRWALRFRAIVARYLRQHFG